MSSPIIIHEAITLNPDPAEFMPVEVTSAFPKGAESTFNLQEKAHIDTLIEAVPDENDTGAINYWRDWGDRKVYLEGWIDKCLAGIGFPPMGGGDWDDKIQYIVRVGHRTLIEKQEERNRPNIGQGHWPLIEGGFREFEAGDKSWLYGVTWGVYEKSNSGGANPMMEHRGTDPEAIKVAERFGLVFDGMLVDLYEFTVAKGPEEAKGITFVVSDLSQVESRLAEKLKEFGIEEKEAVPEVIPEETRAILQKKTPLTKQEVEDFTGRMEMFEGKIYRASDFSSEELRLMTQARMKAEKVKPPVVEGGNPIPEELGLARTLAIIDRRPKREIIESKLREEFGDAVIDALRQGSYVVSGSASYNPPLLVSLKGRELIQGGNPVAKEPWQMTEAEWAKSPQGMQAELTPLQWRLYKDDAKWIHLAHENLIHDALVEGKPVPPEVLADYPELRTTVPNPGAVILRIGRSVCDKYTGTCGRIIRILNDEVLIEPTRVKGEIDGYLEVRDPPIRAKKINLEPNHITRYEKTRGNPIPYVRRQGEWIYVRVGDTEMRGRPDPSGIVFEQVSPTWKRDEVQKAVDTIEGMLKKRGNPITYPTKKPNPSTEERLAEHIAKHVVEKRLRQIKATDLETILSELGYKAKEISDFTSFIQTPEGRDLFRKKVRLELWKAGYPSKGGNPHYLVCQTIELCHPIEASSKEEAIGLASDKGETDARTNLIKDWHIKRKGSNPLDDEEIDRLASKLAAEVLAEIKDEENGKS